MASRDPKDLAPDLQPLHAEWLKRCTAAGINVITTCTARSYQEQLALFAQGKNSLVYTNNLRKIAGLAPITETENKHSVTWTMNSEHIINLADGIVGNDKARAWDFAIVDGKHAIWDIKVDVNKNKRGDYEEAGKIAEDLGLEWGGRWKKPDAPHIQRKSK